MPLFTTLFFYVLANIVLITGLFVPILFRNAFLLPAWTMLVASFMSIHQTNLPQSMQSEFGILLIVTFLWFPWLIHSRKEPLRVNNGRGGGITRSLNTAYKIYNNPRQLSHVSKDPGAKKMTLLWFALQRLLQAAAFYLLGWMINRSLARVFASCTPDDFSPSHQHFLRQLVSGSMTRHDLAVRASVLIYWLNGCIVPPSVCHSLLSILFVAVLRIDDVDEWPPLFGNPCHAYTLRRFWGRFWHQLFSPAAVMWAKTILRKALPLEASSLLSKFLVAFLVFTLSGLAHMAVSWQLGDCHLIGDLFFFWENFTIITLETVALSAAKKMLPLPSPHNRLARMLAGFIFKAAGYLWVSAFLLRALPRYLYPKIYRGLLDQVANHE